MEFSLEDISSNKPLTREECKDWPAKKTRPTCQCLRVHEIGCESSFSCMVPCEDQREIFIAREKLKNKNQKTMETETNQNGYDYDGHVKQVKSLRQGLDTQLQSMKALPSSREVALSITKIQEGIMWLGMELKRLGEANPYPQSYNPDNTKIEPTADNLKL